jgi:hypothetical protein
MKKLLKQYGFKKKWTTDKSGYWWEKKIAHPCLRGLKISVEEDFGEYGGIFVECDTLDVWGYKVQKRTSAYIDFLPFSKKNLIHIMEYFDN